MTLSPEEYLKAVEEYRWDDVIDSYSDVPKDIREQARKMPFVWKMLTFGLSVTVQKYEAVTRKGT